MNENEVVRVRITVCVIFFTIGYLGVDHSVDKDTLYKCKHHEIWVVKMLNGHFFSCSLIFITQGY